MTTENQTPKGEEQGLKYFIEDTKQQHGMWLTIGEMFDSSKPMQSEVSKWTNDPHRAIAFNSREEAEEHNKKFFNMDGIIVTEHLFLDAKGEEQEKGIPKWYTKEQMYDWLIHNDYSKDIATELSGQWAEDLQGAFKKGWEKATNDKNSGTFNYKYMPSPTPADEKGADEFASWIQKTIENNSSETATIIILEELAERLKAAQGKEVESGKNKPFIVANVRELTDKYNDDEISFSRMVEMLNEIAAKYYSKQTIIIKPIHHD